MSDRRLFTSSLLAGGVGALAVLIASVFAPKLALAAWLTAVLTVAVVPLGALPLLFGWHLHKGRWGVILGRDMEAAVATMPLLALMIAPVLFGAWTLFPLHPPGEGHHQHWWLGSGLIVLRGAIYLVVWVVLAQMAVRIGRPIDRAGHSAGLASAGLVLWTLTTSLAGVDWVLALQAATYSSIFGLVFMTHLTLGALAFLCMVALPRPEAAAEPVKGLGNMLLGAVMLWLYHEFSQWLITWSGDLPGHILIYLERAGGGWGWLVAVMTVLGGAAPFVLLLWGRVRGDPRALAALGAVLLAVRAMEAWWWVVPLSDRPVAAGLLSVAALAGAGGLWTAAWLAVRARQPEPAHPRTEEAHGHG